MQHDPDLLRTYLIAGVEDPRVNVQSILSRHLLLVALFGERFNPLLEHELRFACVLNWLNEHLLPTATQEDLSAVRHALQAGGDNAEGLPIPTFVSATFAMLPAALGQATVPNYIAQALDAPTGTEPLAISEPVLATFEQLWAKTLQDQPPSRLTVLEPACGSANDYRFLHSYGLARLLHYTGFDLCEKNVANARAMFPEASFATGNVFNIQSSDLAYDYCFVHDLFEHLSLDGMQRALAEICRVTRHGLALGFFNLHEADEHVVRPTGEYHWNTLSAPRLRTDLERLGFQAQLIHIDTFLKWRFGCDQTHNKNAYTILAERISR
jgi:SAM-dependent methyltransferase